MSSAETLIHPGATVDAGARLAPGVRVGPQAYIGPDVEIGEDCVIGPFCVLQGPMRLGRENVLHAHVCLGDAPQDIGYRGEPTALEIGDRNVFREFVTIHRGTPKDRRLTTVGSDNMFMVYSHVGHDCVIGDGVILGNATHIGGHVTVADRANISALCAVHQFSRIGRNTMIGGGSIVVQDIPPYMMAAGNHAKLYGLNRKGLARAGFSAEAVRALKQAYRLLYRSGLRLEAACERLRGQAPLSAEVEHLLAFLENSKRGVSR
ncbi:acyl-ACP--UDP-N-acetylglucosamine O-acyltransferase [Alkalilimnicola sp. S0819]|uniref:acyl-ACP--UDP-N-acetylglucosamine O-acyltransferase n=1 Tax=Alkalilimnicola sp. S0819 TaxID=2613922 RepID=UPI0012616961|nr:acyl-ACP--UDP-N-acetylglucosamine O-acyltransferase [Alkalilimnicola sp. S0819]KAB7627682.1 acyl-ACP--UDP-N-acetylglucosamine O-acyltransferase [Alkalilimnicola sp. S0819]MPQ15849.1 acyl-ACP--UDP-N-acetylglucosamine O-acyltransferase [Alkalilimnicola sp. S0819]